MLRDDNLVYWFYKSKLNSLVLLQFVRQDFSEDLPDGPDSTDNVV